MTTLFSQRQASQQQRRQPQGGDGRQSGLAGRGSRVEGTVSLLRTRAECYSFWHNFRNMPHFMLNLDSVQVSEDGRRSHWVKRGALNQRIEWDAELTADRPEELIAWRSLPGAAMYTEGAVQFEHAHGNRGTRVRVVLYYAPPGGRLGDALAGFFGRSPEQELHENLRRFKRLLETGEIPTTQGQSSGRGREAWQQTGSMVVEHRLDEGLGWFSLALGAALLAAPESMANLIGIRRHNALLRLIGAREALSGIGILRQERPAGWVWGRVVGDAMDIGLLVNALFQPSSDSGRVAAALAAVLGVSVVDVLAALKLSTNPPGYRAF